MKNLITGSILFVFGIMLYLCYNYFAGDGSSNFGMFSDGVLLGLSIGISLIGIILAIIGFINICRNKKIIKKEKNNVQNRTNRLHTRSKKNGKKN